jgi:predicted dehydrogenase
MTKPLGVAIVGIGWVGMEHLKAFLNNPHVAVVALGTRDEARARDRLRHAGLQVPGARFTRRYADLLAARDVDIVSIATPNHLHAAQAVAAARAGKHFLLEKPTGLDVPELRRIRDAVRRAGVRTIVSFELHYNPYVRLVRWLREGGWLGEVRFARFQYLSRVTDWYSGWSWVRTTKSGRSHLLAAGCHAVDALRWCSGLEVAEVSAYHARYTAGYQWPTSIVVNLRLAGGRRQRGQPLAQVTSSTDFQMPYAFGVELMGDRATLRDDLILWNEYPVDLEQLQRALPWKEIALHPHVTPTGAPAIRIETAMPGTADVGGHPFQGEIDELVDCILGERETHLNVFDAQKTMEVCIAADRSAARGGRPVRLPLIR